MQRIQHLKESTCQKILLNTFFYPSTVPEFIEKFFLLLEFYAFTVFITADVVDNPLYPTAQLELKIFLSLMAFILVKYFVGLSLIRCIYIPFIVWTCIQNFSIFTILNALFILIATVIDIISRIQFSICSANPYSETKNGVKFVHYLIMSIATILKYKGLEIINKQWVVDLLCLILFSVLLFVKSRSKYKNGQFKTLFMRFYILTIFYYLMSIASVWIQVSSPISHILVIIVSQVLYSFVDWKFGTIHLNSYLTDKRNYDLFFMLMSYKFSTCYEQEYEKTIEEFLETTLMENEENDKEKGEEKDIQKESEEQKKKYDENKQKKSNLLELVQKFIDILDEDNSCMSLFLKAQLKFYVKKEVISVKILIEEILNKYAWYELISKICVWKLELEVLKEIQTKQRLKQMRNLVHFLDNENLRIELIRISQQYINLWEYIKNSELVFEKLLKILDKLIEKKEKIHNIFDNLEVKCISMIYFYLDYLYLVEKNVETANIISRQTYLLSQLYLDFHIDEKFYLLLGAQKQDFFVIKNIGFNVTTLLGYERKELKGANASLFLPPFLRKPHENAALQAIENNDEKVYLFLKRTFIRHKDAYYLPCDIVLRMVYNENGEILYEGYIQILKNNDYEWKNFVMVNEEEREIIELGPAIENLIYVPKNTNLNSNDFFSEEMESEVTIDENQVRVRTVTIDGIEYSYQNLQQLRAASCEKIYLYVCFQNYNIKIPKTLTFISSYNKMVYENYTKYEPYTIKPENQLDLNDYFEARVDVQQKITSPCLWIIIILSNVLLLMIIGVEIGSLVYMQYKYEINSQTLEQLETYESHYLQMNKLAMDGNILYMKYELGYEISDYVERIQEAVLKIQQTNQELSEYSKKLYGEQNGWIFNRKMSVNQINVNFITEVYSTKYQESVKLKLMALKNVHKQLKKIFIDSYDEYYIGFQSQLNNFSNTNLIISSILIVFVVIIGMIIFVLILKTEQTVRQNQFLTLDLIAKIKGSQTLINSIIDFLQSMVGTLNYYEEQEHDNKNDMNKADSLNITSRENTGREFIDSRTRKLNYSLSKIQNFGTIEKQIIREAKNEERKNKLKGRSKLFIGILVLLLLGILGFHSAKEIKKIHEQNFSLFDSIINLMKLIRFSSSHSVMSIAFVDAISHDLNRTFFESSIQKYNKYSKYSAEFNEMNYPEFSEFKKIWQNIQYNYVCEYSDCSSEYQTYLNLAFSTTSEKLYNYMQNNFTRDQITDDKFEFRALIYFQTLLDDIVKKCIAAYIKSYEKYKSSLSEQQYIFTGFVMGISGVSAIILTIFTIIKIRKRNQVQRQIINIIRPESWKKAEERID